MLIRIKLVGVNMKPLKMRPAYLHRWCNGIMRDSHSRDPGSIPGRCTFFPNYNLILKHTFRSVKAKADSIYTTLHWFYFL